MIRGLQSKKGMNFPKLLLGMFASIVIILSIYTIMVIVGPNYDSKYAEMFSSGEIINPALDYVGDIGDSVWGFISDEIATSTFLNKSMIIRDGEEVGGTPVMENPLDDYEDTESQPEETNPIEDAGTENPDSTPAEDEAANEDEAIEDELDTVIVKDEDKKDTIKYILILMKAYNLHNPPFSADTPKMEFDMEGEMFNAEVIKGEIYVKEGRISGEDLVVRSNWGEAVVMSKGLNYVKTSFGSGRSTIEQKCENSVCFLKGYKEVYDELSS